MFDVLNTIADFGIIPVIKLDDAQAAVPLGKALIDGGLPVAEITFRTAAAEEAIRLMSKTYPEMLIGAGTVLTCEQADKAFAAGARFIVSPGLNPAVVKHCIDKNIPVVPGVCTPSDIETALEFGLGVLKFFPAEACGGLAAIKAMSAPYGNVKFIPTGGVNESNLNAYLAFNKIPACGGSWMVADALIKDGKFDEITRLTREAVTKMLGFEMAHVGINEASADKAMTVAKLFASVFGFPIKDGNSSVFAGTGVEVNKSVGFGKFGHIAIRTNNIQRAVAFLKRNGVQINDDSAKFKPDGSMAAVYLLEEFGGFAIHLLQA